MRYYELQYINYVESPVVDHWWLLANNRDVDLVLIIFHLMTQILYGSDHMWVGDARLGIQNALPYAESHE